MAASLLQPALLCCTVLLILQLFTAPVYSQVVVDNDKYCRKLGHSCGQPNGPTSQQYCCAEGDGTIPIFRCCNPYTGLFIGVGVAVPTIVLLIILCCVLYFVYARYRRKKLRALLENYSRRSHRHTDSTNFLAPPPYTPLEHDAAAMPAESELPPYSETDQFASTSLTISHGEATPTTQETTPTDDVAPSSEPATAESVESTEVPLEDVPLLSDNDETESS